MFSRWAQCCSVICLEFRNEEIGIPVDLLIEGTKGEKSLPEGDSFRYLTLQSKTKKML